MLDIAQETPLSEQILLQQARYMVRIASKNDNDPVRNLIFQPGSCVVRHDEIQRGRGRPRVKWTDAVVGVARSLEIF